MCDEEGRERAQYKRVERDGEVLMQKRREREREKERGRGRETERERGGGGEREMDSRSCWKTFVTGHAKKENMDECYGAQSVVACSFLVHVLHAASISVLFMQSLLFGLPGQISM